MHELLVDLYQISCGTGEQESQSQVYVLCNLFLVE